MELQKLYQVPVPRKTDSYSPVPHKDIVECICEELDKNNMYARSIDGSTARDGDQVIGYMDIAPQGYDELGMRLAFRNSYDKSMSVAFVAGAVVWICSNGMISGDIQFMRKHTGKVLTELTSKIKLAVNDLSKTFEKSIRHAEAMKKVKVDKTLSAELAGRMFIEHDIITSTQLSIMKKEITEPSHELFKEENLWSFYNHATESLKKAHPSKYFDQHINLHEFVEAEFELV